MDSHKCPHRDRSGTAGEQGQTLTQESHPRDPAVSLPWGLEDAGCGEPLYSSCFHKRSPGTTWGMNQRKEDHPLCAPLPPSLCLSNR